MLHIKQTAVHRIAAGRHIMNINIALPASLQFFCCQEKFLIQLFIQLIKYQAALGRYQGAVGITVFLIANIHDGLTFFINLIQHMHKILLIIAVIPIAFGHQRIGVVQCAFHNIMHLADRYLFAGSRAHLCFNKTGNKIQI